MDRILFRRLSLLTFGALLFLEAVAPYTGTSAGWLSSQGLWGVQRPLNVALAVLLCGLAVALPRPHPKPVTISRNGGIRRSRPVALFVFYFFLRILLGVLGIRRF
jgi:hypothetical protein